MAAAADLAAFAAALDRYLLRRATCPETAALLLAAICLFWPDIQLPGERVIPAYASDALGAALLASVVLRQRFHRPAERGWGET